MCIEICTDRRVSEKRRRVSRTIKRERKPKDKDEKRNRPASLFFSEYAKCFILYLKTKKNKKWDKTY
jgi:hypothetical protein